MREGPHWNAEVEALYREHGDAIYRYFVALAGDDHTAADLSADTWAGLFHSGGGQIEGNPKAFVFGIARHKWLDWLRKRMNAPTVVSMIEEPAGASTGVWAPTGSVEISQALARLREYLGQLPFPQAEAVLLHHGLGHSIAEVGAIQDVGVETAKSRIRYGLEKLRAMMASDDPSEPRMPGD